MFDQTLARRFLNKIGKEIVKGMSSSNQDEVREQLQKALNDITFMYDILHLDEIECIDIGSSNPTKTNERR